MATRKQRARRAKTFRHDYALVDLDEEGNEVELRSTELRAKKQDAAPAKVKPEAKTGGARSGTGRKDPQPPSWERAFRRAALWGLPMMAVMFFFLRSDPVPTRIVIGLVYTVMFIPLTYWLDGMVYRKWEKRKAAPPRASRPGKTR
jgi:hypothetical protein